MLTFCGATTVTFTGIAPSGAEAAQPLLTKLRPYLPYGICQQYNNFHQGTLQRTKTGDCLWLAGSMHRPATRCVAYRQMKAACGLILYRLRSMSLSFLRSIPRKTLTGAALTLTENLKCTKESFVNIRRKTGSEA